MHWRARTREEALLLGLLLLPPEALPTAEHSPPEMPDDPRISASVSSPPPCEASALPSLRLGSQDPHNGAPILIGWEHHVAVAHGDRLDLVDTAVPRLTATWTLPRPPTALARLDHSTTLLAGDADGRIWLIGHLREQPRLEKTLSEPPIAILGLTDSESALVVDPTGAWLVESHGHHRTWLRLPPTDAALTAATSTERTLIAGDERGRIWRWDLTPRPLPTPRLLGQLEEAVVDLAACHRARLEVIASDRSGLVTLLRGSTSGTISRRRLSTRRPVDTVTAGSSCTVAAAASGTAVEVWDLRADAPEQASWSFSAREPLHEIAISPDGLSLAILGASSVRLWSLTDIARPPTTIRGPGERPIAALRFSSDRLLLATPSALAWTEPHST